MAIADVLEWIGRRQISGRLMVDDGQGVTRIFRLETGAPTFSDPAMFGPALGDQWRVG